MSAAYIRAQVKVKIGMSAEGNPEKPEQSDLDSHNPTHHLFHGMSQISTSDNDMVRAKLSRIIDKCKKEGEDSSLYQLQATLCDWAIGAGLQLKTRDGYVGCMRLTSSTKEHNPYLDFYVKQNPQQLQAWNESSGGTTILNINSGKALIRKTFINSIQYNPEGMTTEILTNFHDRLLNLEERARGGGVTLEG